MRLPSISVVFAVALVAFIAFDWYLEYLNLQMTQKFESIESFACNLILEGFLIRPERLWGDMSGVVARKWMELDCNNAITCSRLHPLYTLHQRERISNTFVGLWDSLRCSEIYFEKVKIAAPSFHISPTHNVSPSLNINERARFLPEPATYHVNSTLPRETYRNGSFTIADNSSRVSNPSKPPVTTIRDIFKYSPLFLLVFKYWEHAFGKSVEVIPSESMMPSSSNNSVKSFTSNNLTQENRSNLIEELVPPPPASNEDLPSPSLATDIGTLTRNVSDSSSNNSVKSFTSNNLTQENRSNLIEELVPPPPPSNEDLPSPSLATDIGTLTRNVSDRANPFRHHHVDILTLNSPGNLPHAAVFSLRPSDPIESHVGNKQVSYPYQELNNTYWCMLTRETYINRTTNYFSLPAVAQGRWNEKECEKLTRKADEEDAALEKVYISKIALLAKSKENRVISFGLYGNLPRYTIGAIRNMELRSIYFPDWICRFYVASNVPSNITNTLRELGAQIVHVQEKSMFSRFAVAGDQQVDRFIVRDVDSRLNSRDRLAVEEWIQSGLPIHSIRDHSQHCSNINGGLWGAVRNGFPEVVSGLALKLNDTTHWSFNQDHAYFDDMKWLSSLWDASNLTYSKRVMQHDSYCCLKFPGSRPFPTRRPANFLHVGQVFDGDEGPRLEHIAKHLLNNPTPESCRGSHLDWIYG